MPKTTKEIIENAYHGQGLFYFKKNNINFANDDKWTGQLWFSQSEVTERLDTLRDLLSAQHYDVLVRLRRDIINKSLSFNEHNAFRDEMNFKKVNSRCPICYVTGRIMNNIDSVFSSYGLVDTNKVAGEESPSQASGLRETKEGENPSKPNNTHNGLGKDKLSISSGCTDVLPSKPNKNIKDEVLIR